MTLEFWIALAALVVIILVVIALLPRIRRYLRERELAKALLELGVECRHGVILPDVLEEGVYLDYLVLLPDRIVLLDVKRYRGNIFAGWNMDMWTQAIGRHSFKFPNPLYKLDADIAILKSIAPDVTIEGYIVFASDSRFSRGVPVGVMLLDDVFARFRIEAETPVAKPLLIAWERLTRNLVADSQRP